MSVVVWDGKALAADTQGTLGATKVYQSKIMKHEAPEGRYLLGWVGCQPLGYEKAMWWIHNRSDKEAYPKQQQAATGNNYWARLIVVQPDGRVFCYEDSHVPIPWDEKYGAWGCGMESALVALDLGQDALTAVMCAIRRSDGVGGSVDLIKLVDDPTRRGNCGLPNE